MGGTYFYPIETSCRWCAIQTKRSWQSSTYNARVDSDCLANVVLIKILINDDAIPEFLQNSDSLRCIGRSWILELRLIAKDDFSMQTRARFQFCLNNTI